MTAVSIAELERSPLYSEDLGIALAGGDPQVFRWFLASFLFGGRIGETIARNTYRSFERHGLLTPDAIRGAGWGYLVNPVMREGGYVRYDESKSDRLLRICDILADTYGDRLSALHDAARDSRDLEDRLCLFPGVGPVTANIFLRELRAFWPKADPEPLPLIAETAGALGIDLALYPRHSLVFSRVEAGLLRLAKAARRDARRRPPTAPVTRAAIT
ncbi:MAG: hypothetical protein M0006_07665 [Magnetospirillum sp.]|nr:hypothetical protein [Magnetospirillum sp.]